MTRREVRLGPKRLADGVLELRSPRLRDAAAWSAARLANREWLERAFPAWGGDWAAEQSAAAWVARWWRLRRASARGLAKPLVVLRDGVLVGELGVDAVDPVSGGGEASVWMVRAHGSADLMVVASLLLLEHAFTDPPVLDRLVSPVATTSRRGRSPGLTAAGLRIEGTVPRRVGDAGLVDHDIWTAQNTAAGRARIHDLLAGFPSAAPVPEPRAALPVAALARALVRGTRAAVRARRHRAAPPAPPGVGGGVTLTTSATGWTIVRDGAPVGRAVFAADPGTGCVELELLAARAADRDVLGPVLAAALQTVRTGTFAGLHPAVRVPPDGERGVAPDPGQLAAAGLALVATFEGNPEGPRRWPGEQRWEPVSRG